VILTNFDPNLLELQSELSQLVDVLEGRAIAH